SERPSGRLPRRPLSPPEGGAAPPAAAPRTTGGHCAARESFHHPQAPAPATQRLPRDACRARSALLLRLARQRARAGERRRDGHARMRWREPRADSPALRGRGRAARAASPGPRRDVSRSAAARDGGLRTLVSPRAAPAVSWQDHRRRAPGGRAPQARPRAVPPAGHRPPRLPSAAAPLFPPPTATRTLVGRSRRTGEVRLCLISIEMTPRRL